MKHQASLSKLLQELNHSVQSGSADRDDLLLLFQRIKHENRQMNLQLEERRVQLHQMKQNSFKQSIDLQSAYYERGHLQRQIASELACRSKFDTSAIVSMEHFLAQQPSASQLDDHQRELARLRFELKQRIESVDTMRFVFFRRRISPLFLALSLDQLVQQRRDRLAGLDRDIASNDSILKDMSIQLGTLHSTLTKSKLPLPASLPVTEDVSCLTPPMYTLWLSAQSSQCYSDLQISVRVCQEEQKKSALLKKLSTGSSTVEDEDLQDCINNLDQLLIAHPAYVQISIRSKKLDEFRAKHLNLDRSAEISLKFFHFPQASLISCLIGGTALDPIQSSSFRHLTRGLLQHLFSSDSNLDKSLPERLTLAFSSDLREKLSTDFEFDPKFGVTGPLLQQLAGLGHCSFGFLQFLLAIEMRVISRLSLSKQLEHCLWKLFRVQLFCLSLDFFSSPIVLSEQAYADAWRCADSHRIGDSKVFDGAIVVLASDRAAAVLAIPAADLVVVAAVPADRRFLLRIPLQITLGQDSHCTASNPTRISAPCA